MSGDRPRPSPHILMKTIIQFFILAFFLIPILCFGASSLPKESLVPGGIAILKIPGKVKSVPTGYFQQHRLMILNIKNHWEAIVGIPLAAKAGIHYISITEGKKTFQLAFKIQSKKYPAEYITLKHKKYVMPKKEFLEALKKQQKIIQHCFMHWRDEKIINMHFKMPVDGRISSRFGFQRYYNGEKRSQHRGIDIAASHGVYVRAPGNGIVINTGKYYFTGKTVFIDHGQNLITVYAHLHKILVHKNQVIKRGQIIGTIGRTGRATGPHLHWGVSLNNTRVDPMLFL